MCLTIEVRTMNINDSYIRLVDKLGALRSSLLDELLKINDVNHPEYLQLEKEFKLIGKIIEEIGETLCLLLKAIQ